MQFRYIKELTFLVLVIVIYIYLHYGLCKPPSGSTSVTEQLLFGDDVFDKTYHHHTDHANWWQEAKFETQSGATNIKESDTPYIPYNWKTTDAPLLTLFTTLKPGKGREEIDNGTLRAWASLAPAVRPVMFYEPGDSPQMIQIARQHGWLAFEAPRLRVGIPILRDMFQYIITQVKPMSFFIGYANSDIAFTQDLSKALEKLSLLKWYRVNGQGLLLIGHRWDVLTSELKNQPFPLSMDFAHRINSDESRIGSNRSTDYFITTANGFPFQYMPDFVVGKPGYDNWLLSKANEWNLRVIDCTESITALHLVNSFNNFDHGWFSSNVCMNYDIATNFSTRRGRIPCSPYVLKREQSKYSLHRRLQTSTKCWHEPSVSEPSLKDYCRDIVVKKRVKY